MKPLPARFDFQLPTFAFIVALIWQPARGQAVDSLEASLDPIVVTATRHESRVRDLSLANERIGSEELAETRPGHPSEILGRAAGVWVSQTSGEGHMTAIRQPLSLSPVYLFLENGIPTRSPGFFNQNALNEVDIPGSGAVEILKGPGTALHGSDAVGGVINVLSPGIPAENKLAFSAEAGSFGYRRLLVSAGTTVDDTGVGMTLNAGDSDGWRDGGEHSRISGSVRVEHRLDAKTTLRLHSAFTQVRQRPAGASGIRPEDFERDTKIHYTPISFRDVNALRLSAELKRTTRRGILSLRPYGRVNSMDVLPNWTLTFDPLVWDTSHRTIGLITTYHVEVGETVLISGIDAELSPGSRYEKSIVPVRDGRFFMSYTEGAPIYDYDVTFSQISPFVRLERAFGDRIRLSGGLRLDRLGYDYSNNLPTSTTGIHKRPSDTQISYTHLSPKFGAVWRPSDGLAIFGSYRNAFRIPSENQLFRPGPSNETLELDPVRADQFETGIRLHPTARIGVELAAYRLIKNDDIVRFERNDGTREEQNAGETRHVGVELSSFARILPGVKAHAAVSTSRHTYGAWRPAADVDYSDKRIELSPRELVQARLEIEPPFIRGLRFDFEWQHVGSYWMDPSNAFQYPGHDLLSLRGRYRFKTGFELFIRVTNLTDTRYAERAIYNSFRGEEWTPGAPRTVVGGIRYAL